MASLDYQEYRRMVKLGREERNRLVSVQRVNLSSQTTRNANPNWTAAVDDPNALLAIITLDDPRNLNALSPAMMIQLHDAVLDVTRDPAVKLVIITGTNEAFCSGGH